MASGDGWLTTRGSLEDVPTDRPRALAPRRRDGIIARRTRGTARGAGGGRPAGRRRASRRILTRPTGREPRLPASREQGSSLRERAQDPAFYNNGSDDATRAIDETKQRETDGAALSPVDDPASAHPTRISATGEPSFVDDGRCVVVEPGPRARKIEALLARGPRGRGDRGRGRHRVRAWPTRVG